MTASATLKELRQNAKSQALTRRFMFLWKALGGSPLVKEWRFDHKRQWRFDFADINEKVAIELEGGIWTHGAHTRGKHYNSDCEKYNRATLMGWKVFRLTTDMITRAHVLPLVCLASGKIPVFTKSNTTPTI